MGTHNTRQKLKRIIVDVSGLDRSSIIWSVRSAYTQGYSEIKVVFKNIEAPYLRKADRVLVRDVIFHTTQRLIGVKMESNDEHACILKVTKPDLNENMAALAKRISRLLTEMHAEFLLLCKGHLYASSLIEEKHDTITKLVAYNKREMAISHSKRDMVDYHIVSQIDKIVDIIKYMNRDYIAGHRQMSKTGLQILEHMQQVFVKYELLQEVLTEENVKAFSLKRDDVKRYLRDSLRNMDIREAFIMGQETTILEILIDIVEGIMAAAKA
jgi:hypothetical protein